MKRDWKGAVNRATRGQEYRKIRGRQLYKRNAERAVMVEKKGKEFMQGKFDKGENGSETKMLFLASLRPTFSAAHETKTTGSSNAHPGTIQATRTSA